MLPAGLVSAHDAADLLAVLVLDDRVAAAGVAPDAALPEGRVRDARGDVGRAGNPEGLRKYCKARNRVEGITHSPALYYFAALVSCLE